MNGQINGLRVIRPSAPNSFLEFGNTARAIAKQTTSRAFPCFGEMSKWVPHCMEEQAPLALTRPGGDQRCSNVASQIFPAFSCMLNTSLSLATDKPMAAISSMVTRLRRAV